MDRRLLSPKDILHCEQDSEDKAAEAEHGGDTDDERTYDEAAAGHFPLRVVAAASQKLVAILFKGLANVAVFDVTLTGFSNVLLVFF